MQIDPIVVMADQGLRMVFMWTFQAVVSGVIYGLIAYVVLVLANRAE